MNLQIGTYVIRPFVLTVQEFPEKTAFIVQELRKHGIDVEEFPCINGQVSGLKTIHPYEYDAPGSGWNIGMKSVSLLVSFQSFWTAAMFMPEEYFLFIEWDANFHLDWRKRTEQALKDVPPDFDFLFLGSCCCKGKPTKRIKGDVYDVAYPMCNHAQIISKKAMPTLLRTQRKFYAPVDISLAFHAFPHLKVFAVLPRIVDQFDTNIPE